MISRAILWSLLVVLLMLAGPLATLAFGPVSLSRDWRTASHRSTRQAPDPATHREADRPGLRRPRLRLARRLRRPHLARGETGRRRRLHPLRGDRLVPARRRHGGIRLGPKRARRRMVRLAAAARPRSPRRRRRSGDREAAAGRRRVSRTRAPTARGRAPTATRSSPTSAASCPSCASRCRRPPSARTTFRSARLRAHAQRHRVQASLGGVVGVIAGGDEGFELNVLGLVTGVDLHVPALKLPGIGRVPG